MPRLGLALVALVALAIGHPPAARADLVDKIPEIFKKEAENLLPKAVKQRYGWYKRSSKLIKTYGECVQAGGTPDECALAALLCDAQTQAHRDWLQRSFGAFGRHGPFIAGQLGLFDAFKTTTCGGNCFWCCLTPDGCHSSFGPSPVINCNFNYGIGTHTLGYTLITENPTGTDVCLAIPQTCDLYSECRIASGGGYSDGLPPPPSPFEPPPVPRYGYCTPRPSPIPPISACNLDPAWEPAGGERVLEPRPDTSDELLDAIAERKVRYVTESLARKIRDTIDRYPADHPIDELADLVTLRGCVGHAHLLEHGEPFDGSHAFWGITATNPAVADLVGTRRAMFFIALMRVLGGVPNLYARLAHVESRLWTCQDRVDYLQAAGITDPDGELLKTMSPLALAILKQAEGLQDYRLLAVPLADETPPTVRMYNGCELGSAPVVTLVASNDGDEVVLAVTATDTDGVPAVPALPVTIDWGDGTTSAGELPVDTLAASFRHTYRGPGKYAVVVAVAGQSGLRGLAGEVIEATGGDPAAARFIGFSRVEVSDLQVFADGVPGGNFNVGTIGGSISLLEPDGPQPIGRVPELTVQMKKVETIDGVETVTNPGLTDFGDLVGYNPDRVDSTVIQLRFRRQGGTFWDGRNIHFLLRDVVVDVDSPQTGRTLQKTAALTPALVKVFYADLPATAEAAIVTDLDGTLRIPLTAPRGAGRTPLLDRIELDVAALIAEVDLGDAMLANTPVGVRRRWAEETPCELVAGPIEGFPEEPVDAGVDATDPAVDGGDGGGCAGCSGGAAGAAPGGLLLALGLLVRRRRPRRTLPA